MGNASALPICWSASINNRARAGRHPVSEQGGLLRLAGAVLAESSDEWETEKVYVRMKNSGPPNEE